MKFCPVDPEICRGQVHGPRKKGEREELEAQMSLYRSPDINVVYFQNCVRWPRPPSKMAAMSRHSFNIEPYGSMGFE
jgi:hypothetical protein